MNFETASKGRPKQVDLGIFHLNGLHSQKPIAAIEVKCGLRKGAIKDDFEKLAGLIDKKSSSFGRFIILISEGKVPKFALAKTKSRRARGLIDLTVKGASVSARRTFKAIGSMEERSKGKKPKHTSEHWVVLFEVQ